jgi:hypothetical protein
VTVIIRFVVQKRQGVPVTIAWLRRTMEKWGFTKNVILRAVLFAAELSIVVVDCRDLSTELATSLRLRTYSIIGKYVIIAIFC